MIQIIIVEIRIPSRNGLNIMYIRVSALFTSPNIGKSSKQFIYIYIYIYVRKFVFEPKKIGSFPIRFPFFQ